MSRFADPLNSASADAAHVPFILFADFDFSSGHVRLSSWDRTHTFGGNSYDPGGTLVSIGEVTESNTLNSEKLDFTLSAASTSLMTSALAENYVGRSVTLYFGFANADTQELNSDPEILWEGVMDAIPVKLSRDGDNVIVVTCENRLLLWNDSTPIMYSDEHQKALIDSSDRFFDQVASLADKNVLWGGHRVGVGQQLGRVTKQIVGGFLKKMGFGFF